MDVHGFVKSLTGEIQDHGGDIARLSKFAEQINQRVTVGISMSLAETIVSVSLYPLTGSNSAGLCEQSRPELGCLKKIPTTCLQKETTFQLWLLSI